MKKYYYESNDSGKWKVYYYDNNKEIILAKGNSINKDAGYDDALDWCEKNTIEAEMA